MRLLALFSSFLLVIGCSRTATTYKREPGVGDESVNTAIQFAASASVFAFSLWISLRILSPSSASSNKPGLAVFIGIVFTATSMFGGWMFFTFGLVGLLLILIQFYDLSLIKSFLVVILMFLVQLGIGVVWAALSKPIM